VTPQAALEEARAVDARVAAGERPPLAGVAVAMKDNMWVSGRKTGCASRILEGFRPPGDSTVAARLRAAGAVFVGRANMDEFAMGSSTENSAYQVTRNPWDLDRVAGGSSGGSAAAVAARFVPAGFGSDTGGSIRQPAACCGVVGFKPTYGRVLPLRARRVRLVARPDRPDRALGVGRGAAVPGDRRRRPARLDDGRRAWSAMPEGALGRGVAGLRVGFLREAEEEGLDREVAASLDDARRIFRDAGADVVPVSVPRTTVSILDLLRRRQRGGVLEPREVRRRALRAAQVGRDLASLYVETRTAGFGPEVKRRILLGTFALASRLLRGVLRRGDAGAPAAAARTSTARSTRPTSSCARRFRGQRSGSARRRTTR
jgi:aspartyl-tRNA(Asn)/glutamyl-tRNA(Gln) amidotransferase subunit A